eukprot:2720901-Lingulodinium_polyedra.AAC.1
MRAAKRLRQEQAANVASSSGAQALAQAWNAEVALRDGDAAEVGANAGHRRHANTWTHHGTMRA